MNRRIWRKRRELECTYRIVQVAPEVITLDRPVSMFASTRISYEQRLVFGVRFMKARRNRNVKLQAGRDIVIG